MATSFVITESIKVKIKINRKKWIDKNIKRFWFLNIILSLTLFIIMIYNIIKVILLGE